MPDKPVFVLVHAAGHGGWCWRRVVDRLIERGGRVFAPTLTGMGERSHLLHPEIDLDTHIQDVVNVIECEELNEIVLCGHSYGGMVINGVAERLADRIAALVYLDAFNAPPGGAAWDYVPAERRAMFDAITPGPYLAPVTAEAYAVNAQDREWVDRRCAPTPRAVFRSKLPETNHRARVPYKAYVQATGWSSETLQPFADHARSDGNYVFHQLPHGHDLMIDAPDDVSEILWAAVAQGRQAND